MTWPSGKTNSYRFGGGVYELDVVRDVLNGIPGQPVPRVDWLNAGSPLPEHVYTATGYCLCILTFAQIASFDRALVFENYLPVSWQARAWTPASLAAALNSTVLSGVKRIRRRGGSADTASLDLIGFQHMGKRHFRTATHHP